MINLSEIIVVAVMIRRRWCLLEDAGIISDALEKKQVSMDFLMNYVFYTFIAGSMVRWRFAGANFGPRLLGPFQGPKKNLKRI